MTEAREGEKELKNMMTPLDHIDSSVNEIDKILEEYSKLVCQGNIRLFTTQQHAATTNKNILQDALVRTVDINSKSLAYRHKLAKDVLWLWLCVYCMKAMYELYSKRYMDFCARKEEYQEAIWEGVIKGINDSLSTFKEGKGRLKSYVYWMVLRRVSKKVQENVWGREDLSAFSDNFDKADPLSDTERETQIREIFEKLEDELHYGEKEKDLKKTFNEAYSDLAEYIRQNLDTFEMVLMHRNGETLVEIGGHFDISKDTVSNRIKGFKKYIYDNYC